MSITFHDDSLRFAAPKGMVATCICSALLGFLYLLALLFVIPNTSEFMTVQDNDSDTINLTTKTFQLVLPHPAALAFTIFIISNLYLSGISSVTVTSRIG